MFGARKDTGWAHFGLVEVVASNVKNTEDTTATPNTSSNQIAANFLDNVR